MSKSRADRKTPNLSVPPPAPVSNDVVPGRFTESDWNQLLEDENEEDFMVDILQDVITSALDTIYDKLIASRVIPYCVEAAKELIVDVIEWQFLVNDPGEHGVNEDKTWLEDEEPVSGVTDSWAQGIVPVMDTKENIKSAPIEEEHDNVLKEDKEDGILDDNIAATESSFVPLINADAVVDKSSEVSKDKTKSDNGIKVPKKPEGKRPQKPAKTTKQAGKPFKPYRGRLSTFRSINTSPITDERTKPSEYDLQNETINGIDTGIFFSSASLIKAHYERIPGAKEIAYDIKGNTVQVHKLNMDRLPSHRVKTRFSVVDPVEEAFQAKLANKKQRYNLLRHDGRTDQKDDSQMPSDTLIVKEKETKVVSPLPPPLVDTIEVSTGVVIKEKGVIKRGLRQPLNNYYTSDAAQLLPLGSTHSGTSLKIREPLSETNLLVKPLNANKPLPAIPSRGMYY